MNYSVIRLPMLASLTAVSAGGAYNSNFWDKPKPEPPMRLKSSRQPSRINQQILNRGQLSQICERYNPPWFYFQNFFAQVYGQVIPNKYNDGVEFKYERVFLENNEEQGKIVLDIVPKQVEHATDTQSEKIMIMLHGVAGDSSDNYMQELTGACASSGINVVVFNHYAPPGEQDLRLMNMCTNKYLDEVIQFSEQKFAQESKRTEIYLCGFSLGGNHILRYVGQAGKNRETNTVETQDQSTKVTGVISVCNPFDVVTTAKNLKKSYGGIFYKVIAYSQYSAFRDKRFIFQDQKIAYSEVQKANRWDVLQFDDATRSKIWGEGTATDLYRHTSCQWNIQNIDTPFLVLTAKDDPIVLDEDVPHQLLSSNPNCLHVDADVGGHCDFFTRSKDSKKIERLFPDIIIQYMNELSSLSNK